MRTPSDLPPSRAMARGDRGRIILIAVAAAVIALVVAARYLSSFYVDFLWHQSIDRTDIFWGALSSKAALFSIFGITFTVLAILNLIIADRLAPTTFSANTHPVVERFHEYFGQRLRIVRFAVAVVFGFLFALPAASQWQSWLLFRNSTSFGRADARFGNDVGFYIFRLPFVTFVVDWLFAALIFIILLVVMTHVLTGGIILQPPRPKVRRATKAHIAVLLAVLALVKAGDYWLARYELTTARRGVVRGITYAVDNAQLPAVLLLALISVLTAVLYLVTLRTDRWRPAIVASALWAIVAVVGGVIYPVAVQGLVVKPNQRDREASYIGYNIEATRHAIGIDEVEVRSVEFDDLGRSDLVGSAAALRDVRFVKPDTAMEQLFRNQVGQPGQNIVDLDPGRYEVDGKVRQVIVGARELDLRQVGNTSWQGIRLINTHGCGLSVAVAGQITRTGNPAYRNDVLDIERPELYYSPSLDGYAVVNTTVAEQGCGATTEAYSGESGILLDGPLRRLAVAIDAWEYNLIGSSAIVDESRLLSVRDVRDRVSKVAPFLALDADPYPVVVGGRILWVIDAYTLSDRYPNAEFADVTQLDLGAGLGRPFNYVRNSVKATVDAYDGSVVLYAVDGTDPILQVWSTVFPDMFTPATKMPAGLPEHLRYPEELFRVQTAAYSKYRLAADAFFDRQGAWSVGLAPANTRETVTTVPASAGTDGTTAAAVSDFALEADAPRFEPYYVMFHADGGDESNFALYRPFSPFSASNQRKELSGYMIAVREPGYGNGRLIVYEVGSLENGPYTVAAQMFADPDVSRDVTLFNQQRSVVSFGDLQMLPVSKGVLWTMPLYVESQQTGVPQIQRIIAYYDGEVGYGSSLTAAITELFPGFDADLDDVVDAGPSTPTDPTEPTEPGDATAEELLQQAEDLFNEADQALQERDLATYAAKIEEARNLVREALDLIGD
ncbi:MAG: UPF0182 family protein [Ilumatobacteraceae bacterium]